MGLTNCKIHGRVGFVETCRHVAQEIDGGETPHGHRLTTMGTLFICGDCFSTLGFQPLASLSDLPLEEIIKLSDGRMEAFETAYNAMDGRRIFCAKCFPWP